jgi:threonine dehydratase
MNVVIEDRPGSLARLTQLLAAQGANVLQAIHDRSEPTTLIDQTEVALTLETRGPEHSQEVIQALQNQVVRLELTH